MLEVAENNPYFAPLGNWSASHNFSSRGMASTPMDLFVPIMSPADRHLATEEPAEEEEVKVLKYGWDLAPSTALLLLPWSMAEAS